MDKNEINALCEQKAEELIQKHFPSLPTHAEQVGNCYPADLPFRVQKEYYDFLEGLWKELSPDNLESFVDIMDRYTEIPDIDSDYIPTILKAKKDSEIVTLWERIRHSNHEDITWYHGLLKEYARKLLDVMRRDFVEDIL